MQGASKRMGCQRAFLDLIVLISVRLGEKENTGRREGRVKKKRGQISPIPHHCFLRCSHFFLSKERKTFLSVMSLLSNHPTDFLSQQ